MKVVFYTIEPFEKEWMSPNKYTEHWTCSLISFNINNLCSPVVPHTRRLAGSGLTRSSSLRSSESSINSTVSSSISSRVQTSALGAVLTGAAGLAKERSREAPTSWLGFKASTYCVKMIYFKRKGNKEEKYIYEHLNTSINTWNAVPDVIFSLARLSSKLGRVSRGRGGPWAVRPDSTRLEVREAGSWSRE